MLPKHKQALHLQKAVCGWEIKWSKSHQYLPSFMSTCLSDTFFFVFQNEKENRSIPQTRPSSQHDAVCVWGFFSHCLRSEDTIGWQRNARKLTTDTQDRERKESNTFVLLFLFSAPLLSLLALQQVGARDEQSVPPPD